MNTVSSITTAAAVSEKLGQTGSLAPDLVFLKKTPSNSEKTPFQAVSEKLGQRGAVVGGVQGTDFPHETSPASAASAYLRNLKIKNYRANTIRYAAHSLKRLLGFLEKLEIENLAVVTPRHIEEFRQAMFLRRTREGKPLDFRTQKSILEFVKGFFAYLEKEGVLHASPARRIKYPRPYRKISRNHLSVIQMRKLLESVKTDTLTGFSDRTLFELFYATGLRQGEMTALKVKDIEWDEPGDSPDLGGAMPGHSPALLRVENGKGGKDRVVPIGETAEKYLRLYLHSIRPKLLGENESPYLFLRAGGNPIDSNDVGRKLLRYRVLSRLENPISAHVFRRSLATHLLKSGVDLRFIQNLLGHASPQATLEYLKVSTDDLLEVLERCHPRARKAGFSVKGEDKPTKTQEPHDAPRVPFREVLPAP